MSIFDIHMMAIITVIAIFLKLLEFPMAPMLLGFILGGLMENNLSRALTISDGSFSFLWERPLSLGIVITAVLVLVIPPLSEYWKSRRQVAEKDAPEANSEASESEAEVSERKS
ncbi:hypothetical protein OFY17_11795 [Marinomonas sp. C2222]|uniref:Tricarboxylate transport membrane protein TctA n=1 Tax=Marinomonas sargassi TaxID=2984494 RepID=A0ABT2YUJ2_9GAMM|nr:hypothetical protein [Marinomonas sargassi]MCV2403555.1 hypothetical protein [Marinomonas sargassi]